MNVSNDVLYKILQKIPISTQVKYIPHEDGDAEQNRTIFFKTNYPYNLVNKEWNSFYNIIVSKL